MMSSKRKTDSSTMEGLSMNAIKEDRVSRTAVTTGLAEQRSLFLES